jgi:F0F1-type ATP synthase beta subunit
MKGSVVEVKGPVVDVEFKDGTPEKRIIDVLNSKWDDFDKKDAANQNNRSVLDNKFEEIKDDLQETFK